MKKLNTALVLAVAGSTRAAVVRGKTAAVRIQRNFVRISAGTPPAAETNPNLNPNPNNNNNEITL